MSIKNSILSHSNQFNHYKNESERLKKENEKLKKQLEERNQEIENIKFNEEFEDGISIIIPTYKGENHINPLLNSLEEQTLDRDKFELIFIINGERDSTLDILLEFAEKNKDMDITITYTKTPGVSNARNIGLKIAKKQYTGFIDDDDFVSPNYLKKLYEYSRPNRVVMTNFVDINEETGEEMESFLVPYDEKEHGVIKDAPVKFLNLALSTVAKSIPSFATKSVRFNTNLTSGVDPSYYSFLYPKFDFEFYFINKEEEATYYRLQREGSISRQKMSYQFNVLDRLKVVDDLDKNYRKTNIKKYKKYLQICVIGQAGFMKKYIIEHPDEKEKVIEEVKNHNLAYFPYKILEEL